MISCPRCHGGWIDRLGRARSAWCCCAARTRTRHADDLRQQAWQKGVFPVAQPHSSSLSAISVRSPLCARSLRLLQVLVQHVFMSCARSAWISHLVRGVLVGGRPHPAGWFDGHAPPRPAVARCPKARRMSSLLTFFSRCQRLLRVREERDCEPRVLSRLGLSGVSCGEFSGLSCARTGVSLLCGVT